MDLALNTLQRLIYHKTQPTNQPTNQPLHYCLNIFVYFLQNLCQILYFKTECTLYKLLSLVNTNIKVEKVLHLGYIEQLLIVKCQCVLYTRILISKVRGVYFGIMDRVSTYGSVERGSIPGGVIPKTHKTIEGSSLLNIQDHNCSVGWGCRIHWLSLCREVTPPTSAPDMTLNNLMARSQ